MPRFHFNIRDDSWLYVKDNDGAECADLDAAIAEALSSARWILNDDIRVGKVKPEREYEITNEHGQLLAKVLFRDALSS